MGFKYIWWFLKDFPDHILDLGGGSSVCEYDDELEKLKLVFENENNVFLLLPSDDFEESINFLNKRTGWTNEGRNLNIHFLKHRSNYELSKHRISVMDRDLDDICDEIIAKIK